jgi:hypothetical protein
MNDQPASQSWMSSDWRVVGTYREETEARIAPFDAVPLNVRDCWPRAAPGESDVTP